MEGLEEEGGREEELLGILGLALDDLASGLGCLHQPHRVELQVPVGDVHFWGALREC